MSRTTSQKNKSAIKKMLVAKQDDHTGRNEDKVKLKTLVVNGEKYRTAYTAKYANRKKWIRPDDKRVISFIPCTIIKVFVSAGQKVDRNDEIVVMEAMKMQNTIHSPVSGIVKNVNIKAGDKVPKGYVMIEYQ